MSTDLYSMLPRSDNEHLHKTAVAVHDCELNVLNIKR